jgi:hypothetical protein
MTLKPFPSEFPYTVYEENFYCLFFQCIERDTLPTQLEHHERKNMYIVKKFFLIQF